MSERPPGSLFGDDPSGCAFGRMRQIYMGRANPFRALVAGLTADKHLTLREAVDERRCRDEVGVGTLAEAAEVYRPDSGCADRPVAIKRHRDQRRPQCLGAISAVPFRDIRQCSSEQILITAHDSADK